MFKISIFVVLVLIAGIALASSLSCQSCGAECARACGTRRFRFCCFNYLRRKRGPETVKVPALNLYGINSDGAKLTASGIEDQIWSVMSNDYKPSSLDDIFYNGLQTYDA